MAADGEMTINEMPIESRKWVSMTPIDISEIEFSRERERLKRNLRRLFNKGNLVPWDSNGVHVLSHQLRARLVWTDANMMFAQRRQGDRRMTRPCLQSERV